VGYLIGTDEAGYGPNLGPLVVSASIWQVPPGVRADDLYELLEQVVCQKPERIAGNSNGRIPIADSKTLYHPGEGLRHLERGLWAAWAALDQRPDCWSEVWHTLAPGAVAELLAEPWNLDYDSQVPIDAKAGELDALGDKLCQGFAAKDIWLIDLVSRPVFPRQFNELLDRHESKGSALSNITLELIREVMEPLEGGPISVICDKHGGRDHYSQLLSEFFPDYLIEVHGENRLQSVYRFGPAGHRVEVRFSAKAECYLPVALASMASKYLRELAMRAFNEYWCDRVADLEPTAGYPLDAKRFKDCIAPTQRELGIDDNIIWRTK
jgi:ribonuclease HII